MSKDLLSPALRAAEREIDGAHLTNALIQRGFGEAAWYFLAFCEERLILPMLKSVSDGELPSTHEQAAQADEVINHAKWPLRWLRKACPEGQIVPPQYSDDVYQASWDLSRLASSYSSFESAFTYASLGVIELRLEGHRIIPSGPLREDTRFEAYDRLTDLDEHDHQPDLDFVAALVNDDVRVDGSRFSYPLNPRTVSESLRHIEPELNRRFRLPEDWRLSDYSLGEYSRVAKCLWAMSAIHFVSRVIAASRGCIGLGYQQALVLMSHEEFFRRLTRYTALDGQTVRAITSDLTYGAGKVLSPDPALQPLVRLTKTVVGWAPGLLLNNALERNLIVLSNRLPDSRSAYTRLSQQKEVLLRSRIADELQGLGFRFWHGDVVDWEEPLDVDLAVISEEEKRCLLLELKSFIAPAEAREIRDRSEEIARGIQQVKTRQARMEKQPQALRNALRVSSDYGLTWAVASETSIGAAWVQDESVPVVRAGHLIRKLCQARRLAEVCEWLSKREYLPVEGREYDVVDVRDRIGNWELEWYGIKGLGESHAVESGGPTSR